MPKPLCGGGVTLPETSASAPPVTLAKLLPWLASCGPREMDDSSEEEVPVDDERIPIRQLAFSPAEDLMPRTTRAPRTTLMSDSDDDSDSE